MYFGKATQEAVEEYLATDSATEKHRIFNERLHAPFAKLIENIVFTYKFINLEENVTDLQLECLSHVYMNLHKYKPGKGKAYSYFGTMVKNYLIQKTIKASKQRNIYLIDEKSENLAEQMGLPHEEIIDPVDEFNTTLIELLVERLDKGLPDIKNHNEKKVVQAVLYLLEHRQDLDLFNKKQLYVLLREITNLPTKKITQALNKVKHQYFQVRHKFVNEGY